MLQQAAHDPHLLLCPWVYAVIELKVRAFFVFCGETRGATTAPALRVTWAVVPPPSPSPAELPVLSHGPGSTMATSWPRTLATPHLARAFVCVAN